MVHEDTNIVWSAISSVLTGFYVLLEEIGGHAFPAFKAFGKSMVVHALNLIGWDPKPTDGHTDKLMRSVIIGLLDMFAHDDPAVAAEAKRRFDLHFTEPSALPSEYKTTVYRIVLTNGGEKEFEQVKGTYYATEDNIERKYAMNSLGATSATHLKRAVLDWTVKSGDVKLQDVFYPMGSVSSSNKQGCEQTWQYFQENFGAIKGMLSKASPSLMDAVIVYSTNRFCTRQRADEIEAFFTANPLPHSARRISQSVETIRSNALMLERIKNSKVVLQQGFL
jgi:puromycin-sensitive aminopeptidase